MAIVLEGFMEYYIYLLQIFGGGNPKIHEVIKAYGNARLAYEHISSGDMSHIPSNRHEYVRRASLERSKVIMDYCAGNNIGIVTIDNRTRIYIIRPFCCLLREI